MMKLWVVVLECEDWISTWRQLWSPRLFAWEDTEERNQGFVTKASGSAVARQVDLIESDSLQGEYLASFSKIWKIHILSLNSRSYLSKGDHLIMPFPTWSPAMGSHYLCVSVLVAQSCLTLSNPMDDSLPGSCPWNSPGNKSGVGCYSLLQGSSQPTDQTWVSCIAGGFFIIWATREAPITYRIKLKF